MYTQQSPIWVESIHFQSEGPALLNFRSSLPNNLSILDIDNIVRHVEGLKYKFNVFNRHDFENEKGKWFENGNGCDIGFCLNVPESAGITGNQIWLGLDPVSAVNQGSIEALDSKWSNNHVVGKSLSKNSQYIAGFDENHRYYAGFLHGDNGQALLGDHIASWRNKMGKVSLPDLTKQSGERAYIGVFVSRVTPSPNPLVTEKLELLFLTNAQLPYPIHIDIDHNIYTYKVNSELAESSSLWEVLHELYLQSNKEVELSGISIFGEEDDEYY